jgi:hypothetical protein
VSVTNGLRETIFATAYDVSLETCRGKSYLEPEKKLMIAVLDDAIACLQKYAFARDRKRKVLFQEAENWVQDTNTDWPVSFANVCEILGFAPDYLRQGLGQCKAAKLKSRQRPRSISYRQDKARGRRGIQRKGKKNHR